MGEIDGYEIPSSEYEQACLQAVRRALSGLREDRDQVRVKNVELVRSDDCVCIVAFLVRHGEDTHEVWRLYEDVFSGIPPAGSAEPPQGVADQMLVWAMGG